MKIIYSLSLNAKHMSGNIYMNFMYVTLVEIPAILILIPLAKLISRRLLLGLDYAYFLFTKANL